ncbi:LysR family transcriptional regulator [Promicromonospora soli]
MERRQLEYFLAVVEHGGFTNASRVLHVAQPSLSYTIASLEAEVGGALFHRLPHGATLTPAGEALVAPARQVVRDLATASASVREALGLEAGKLDIVTQTMLAVDPLSALLARFLDAHPKVAVRVTDPEQGARVAKLVRSGACELGLVDAGEPLGDLEGFLLGVHDLKIVLPPDKRPRSGTLRMEQLAMLRFVVTPPGSATRGTLDSAFRAQGLEPLIAVETAHRAMVLPLVLAGAGASLLPTSMAADAAAKGAVVVTTDPVLSYQGRLIWRFGPLSPAAERFVALARDYFSEAPPRRTAKTP